MKVSKTLAVLAISSISLLSISVFADGYKAGFADGDSRVDGPLAPNVMNPINKGNANTPEYFVIQLFNGNSLASIANCPADPDDDSLAICHGTQSEMIRDLQQPASP